MPRKRFGTAILENGRRIWKWFEDYDYNSNDFDLLGRRFQEFHRVKQGKIANANCKLFNIREGVDFAYLWLSRYRFSKDVFEQYLL